MNSTLKYNFVANLIGKIWTGLISISIIPVYIYLLGIEAYGLIGIFLSIIAILAFLDFGLGNVLNHQLAKMSLDDSNPVNMHNLVNTLEIIYWAVGICTGISLVLLSSTISTNWIKPELLNSEYVEDAIKLMGVVLLCQWPRSLYYAGLMGLQKQVAMNVSSTVMATLLNIGGVLILLIFTPTIHALFYWYLVVGLLETLIARYLLIKALPKHLLPGQFKIKKLTKDIWHFAVGVTGVTIVATILTQLDKVILSKVLSLENFAYYSIASRLAAGLYYFISPVTSAFFPKLTQLAMSENKEELAKVYHTGCQLLSISILPITVILSLFSNELLFHWTQNQSVADNSSSLLTILTIGTAINGMIAMPASLQFAHGWTKLTFYFNLFAVVLIAPATYLLASYFGPIGAAWVWLILNCSYVLFMIRIMHKRILKEQMWHWFKYDFGFPSLAVIIVAVSWKLIFPSPDTLFSLILNIIGVSFFTVTVSVASSPLIFEKILYKFKF